MMYKKQIDDDPDEFPNEADEDVARIMDTHGINRKKAEQVNKMVKEQSMDENIAVEQVLDELG